MKEEDTVLLNKILGDTEVKNFLPGDPVFHYGIAEDAAKKKGKSTFLFLYAIKTENLEAFLQNADIGFAEAEISNNDIPGIQLRFNHSGSKKWEYMIRKNIGKYLAIIIDRKVISAPRVLAAITGGNAVISGGFTLKEAINLAKRLRTGYLPARLTILTEEKTPAKAPARGKKWLLTGIAFLVGAAAAFALFNTLKSK